MSLIERWRERREQRRSGLTHEEWCMYVGVLSRLEDPHQGAWVLEEVKERANEFGCTRLDTLRLLDFLIGCGIIVGYPDRFHLGTLLELSQVAGVAPQHIKEQYRKLWYLSLESLMQGWTIAEADKTMRSIIEARASKTLGG